MKNNITYCGSIGIIGRVNVGKSSILNCLIGDKISITSNKSGTTRKNITGIKTINKHQCIYIDTPGFEVNQKYITYNILHKKNYLQLIIFVIKKTQWNESEKMILEKIKKLFIPTILVINKIDHIKNKKILLPFIQTIRTKYNFLEIIPISAKTGENIEILSNIINNNLPKSKYIFSKNIITTVSKNFMISEIIREKLIYFLHQELPYLIKIKVIKCYTDIIGIYHIHAVIITKNIRQKKIIIGKNGNKIKICRKLALKDIKKYLNKSVTLHLNITTIK